MLPELHWCGNHVGTFHKPEVNTFLHSCKLILGLMMYFGICRCFGIIREFDECSRKHLVWLNLSSVVFFFFFEQKKKQFCCSPSFYESMNKQFVFVQVMYEDGVTETIDLSREVWELIDVWYYFSLRSDSILLPFYFLLNSWKLSLTGEYVQ